MFKPMCVLCACLMLLPARQVLAETPKPEPPKTVEAKPGCPSELSEAQKARALYEEALINEATGNLGAAREMYERLVQTYAPTQFACWAQLRLTDLKEGKARINKEGRAQFIVGTTLFGAWSGYSLAAIATWGDDDLSDSEMKGMIWASIGGAAAGLIPAIIFTGEMAMSTGRATLINFGWTWGLWHGIAFSIMTVEDPDPQVIHGLALGLSAVGWTGTLILTNYVDVADGDAALVAAGGAWGTWFTFAIGALISEDFLSDEDVWVPIILVGGDAGVATTALLTDRLDMSAGRVGLINLGGILGMLLGGGILVLAEPDDYRAAVGIELGFSIAGLVGAWLLTRGYDEPGSPATGLAALELTPEGWSLGAPIPRITPAWVEGRQAVTVDIPVIGGRF